MKKILKRALALVVCAGFCFGLAACHPKNEVALNIGGVQFTSAYYSCALVHADSEARNRVDSASTTEGKTTDYFSQTIEGTDYSTWVKNRALQLCKDIATYSLKCSEAQINAETYLSEAQSNAEFLWNYYGYSLIMPENGVSLETFKAYYRDQGYQHAYFDSIYGENGSNPIAAQDVEKGVTENYAVADMLTFSDADATEDEFNEEVKKFEAFAERIKKGEKFAKIYSEYYSTEYTEDKESDIMDYSLATVAGDTDTNYANEAYAYLKDMKNGEVKVVKKEAGEGTPASLYLLLKGDIMAEENVYLDGLKTAVRQDLKGEEFLAGVAEFAASLQLEENTFATKQFKVKNIYYPSY